MLNDNLNCRGTIALDADFFYLLKERAQKIRKERYEREDINYAELLRERSRESRRVRYD